MIVVDVDSTNVSFDGVNYPKMFYARTAHNNVVEIRNQNTDKLFKKEPNSQVSVDGANYPNTTLTVTALNTILTPTLV